MAVLRTAMAKRQLWQPGAPMLRGLQAFLKDNQILTYTENTNGYLDVVSYFTNSRNQQVSVDGVATINRVVEFKKSNT